MKKNFILLAFLLVLLLTEVVGGFARPAAEETIYIRADGSIEGTTAISTVDNTTYTFTNNILDDKIVVERSNIIIDGAGYTLEATVYVDWGITLTAVNNVTIKNTNIKGFYFGGVSLTDSSNNSIIANTITANEMDGIALGPSSNNNISGNNITNNGNVGIRLEGASSNNIITANNIANNDDGIVLAGSSNNNSIIANNITANDNDGIRLAGSSNNMIYHNNIIDNGQQVNIVADGSSDWDDGAKGNYWSDYESRYPNATEVDGSGIWGTPYVIDENNQDNYPIIPEFPTWTSTLLALILLAVVITIYKRRLLKTPIL